MTIVTRGLEAGAILLIPCLWPAWLSSGIEADIREWEQILLILPKGSLFHRCVMWNTRGTGASGLGTVPKDQQTGTEGMRPAPLTFLYPPQGQHQGGPDGAAVPP